MLTFHEVAERLGAGVASVRVWAWHGRFPGARKESTPIGDYWLIPETAVDAFEPGKAGRPPKKSGSKGRRKK